MVRNTLLLTIFTLTITASLAWSQYRRPNYGYGHSLTHQVEITPFGGYGWTDSYDISYRRIDNSYISGKLDIKSSAVYGGYITFNLPKPGSQLEALYSRQDSELVFRRNAFEGGDTTLADVAVDYWHVGGSFGIPRGNILPFTSLTLGATRLAPKNVASSDVWRFSVIFSIGAKVYLNERVGLRAQFRLPVTIVEGGAGIYCDRYGCYTTLGGTGVLQADFSGGLMILL